MFFLCSPPLIPSDIFVLHTRIHPREVVLQIAMLFDGYPDLAQEFNVFLPPGYTLQPQGEGKASHTLLRTPE